MDNKKKKQNVTYQRKVTDWQTKNKNNGLIYISKGSKQLGVLR